MNDAPDNGLHIGDFHFDPGGPLWFRTAAIIAVAALFIGTLIWVFRDAERRGRGGCIALLFLFSAGWPFSILWWLWLRPPLLQRPTRLIP